MLHGPAAAARFEREGETRQGVLDAVRYHTIGYLEWDRTGRALYMADFLEPGRSFSKREPRVSRGAGAGGLRRRVRAGRARASSSGRCTRDIRCSPRPWRSGTRFDEAARSSSCWRWPGSSWSPRLRRAMRTSRRDVPSSGRSNDRAPDSVRDSRAGAQRHEDARPGAPRDDAAARSRVRRRGNGHRSASRATRRSCSTCPATPTGRGASRASLGHRARRVAHRQLTLPGCRRRSWVDVAAAGRAVLPVAVRTPRRCRRRGSFAPRPRRRASREARFANARIRSDDDRREAPRAARMQRNQIHERATLPRERAPTESRAPRRRSRRRASRTRTSRAGRTPSPLRSRRASGYFVLIGISSRRSASLGA